MSNGILSYNLGWTFKGAGIVTGDVWNDAIGTINSTLPVGAIHLPHATVYKAPAAFRRACAAVNGTHRYSDHRFRFVAGPIKGKDVSVVTFSIAPESGKASRPKAAVDIEYNTVVNVFAPFQMRNGRVMIPGESVIDYLADSANTLNFTSREVHVAYNAYRAVVDKTRALIGAMDANSMKLMFTAEIDSYQAVLSQGSSQRIVPVGPVHDLAANFQDLFKNHLNTDARVWLTKMAADDEGSVEVVAHTVAVTMQDRLDEMKEEFKNLLSKDKIRSDSISHRIKTLREQMEAAILYRDLLADKTSVNKMQSDTLSRIIDSIPSMITKFEDDAGAKPLRNSLSTLDGKITAIQTRIGGFGADNPIPGLTYQALSREVRTIVPILMKDIAKLVKSDKSKLFADRTNAFTLIVSTLSEEVDELIDFLVV